MVKIRLVQYPQMDASETLRTQIIALQSTAWPLSAGLLLEEVIWPEDLQNHKTSFVLITQNKASSHIIANSHDNDSSHDNDGSHDIAISHVSVLEKCILHKGIQYRAFGLSEVVTHPNFKRKGLASRLLKEAILYIENNSPDICIFTCYPALVPLYSRAGLELMKDTYVVGGTPNHPLCSQQLGLSTMMAFYSDLAKSHRSDFENSEVLLRLSERKLW